MKIVYFAVLHFLLCVGLCQALSLPGELAHYPLTDGDGVQAREALNRFPPAEITGSFWTTRDGLSVIDFGGMKNSRQAQVLLPRGMAFDGEFTIAVWLSAYWWKENWGPICYRSDATYGIRNNMSRPGQIHFRVKDKGAERGANLFSSTVLDKNVWHHVVATFTPGKAMRIYIDGQLDAERTENVPVSLDDADRSRFKLGRCGEDASFSGVLYNLHLFSRALAAAEVATLYRAENRFGLAVNETTIFPKEGAVATVLPGVEILAGGALRIAGQEGTHLLNSLFSYPVQPAMGYNLLAPSARGEQGWRPIVRQVSENQASVTAQGAFHRLERMVTAMEDGRIRVQDKVTNLTQDDLAVVFYHCLFPERPLADWYLHGEEKALSASDGRIPPS
ncbi:MAG: LamG domain-containing protein, partial [Victivallales bacterium]|nr:LamG domain-containing protein [Victivallales bacterium]